MKSRTYCVVGALAMALEIVGFVTASRGVVRESFVELSRETGGFSSLAFSMDAFDRHAFDFGQESVVDRFIVKAGLVLGLLPSDRELTQAHRRQNARWAIAGVSMAVVGMALDAGRKYWRPAWYAVAWLGRLPLRSWRGFKNLVRSVRNATFRRTQD